MITGAHSIIYSTNPDADRDFLCDVIGLPHVDVGHGWLIFGLPPSEVAIHPADQSGAHELYFMCDDIERFVAEMRARNVECDPLDIQRWGRISRLTLPGGGKLGVYQPTHPRPEPMIVGKTATKKVVGFRPPKKAVRRAATTSTRRAARTKGVRRR